MTALDSPYTSAAFVMSLVDSIRTVENDAKDTNRLLQHKEDNGTSMDLHTRVQDHLRVAELKLRFVGTLERSHPSNMWFGDEILGKDADDVQFIIRVR